jgi:DNA-binding transcriptional LysR family regulator
MVSILYMAITLEQARALDALARHGTFAAAATALRKRHTAVLYAMRTLEEQTDLRLLDRRGYRTRLTDAGARLLEECRRLLAAERSFDATVHDLRGGWEPQLRIVFDGVVPAEPIVREVVRIADRGPTRVHVSAEFLAGVEAAFVRDEADVMISVVPPEAMALDSRPMPPIRALLVAHATHPLSLARRPLSRDALAGHVLVSVRGSDPRLELPTASVEPRSAVSLNDFAAKKSAIVAGTGYGWLPEYLVEKELAKGTLRRVRWEGESLHAFSPRLYTRVGRRLGRAASQVVERLLEASW